MDRFRGDFVQRGLGAFAVFPRGLCAEDAGRCFGMKWLKKILRAREGAMTSELVLRPGEFGLGKLPSRLKPVATTSTICGFCSTGCSLKVHLNEKGEAINLSADPNYPVNLGMACPKGWEALTPLKAKDRATQPLLRNREGVLEPADWNTAIAAFVKNFQGIQAQHGKASISFLGTGQIVAEEMALLGALAKFGMGMLHIDSNTRQCMATSHVAYKQSFGFDAPPFTYKDFEESDALIFVGSNPCIAHPIMWQRVMMNRRNPEIVVVDPRRTETAMAATLHVALRPKSDLVFLYGIAHLLIVRGAINRAFIAEHCTGFEEFAAFLRKFPLERTATETGLPAATIERVVEIIATRERVSFWWTMGVNQGHESTRTAQALINLALMTGNIGRPGTGANSITGQCNAMGSRLFGNATSLIGGYDFGSPEDRAHIAKILAIDESRIPAQSSWAYDQILDGIDRGEIRGLWVIATNTAHSWVNQSRFAELRKKLDFLVVQDMYVSTETARMADLVLPAAGWGEKEGVMINSERRLGVVRKVARAPGQALSDFAIFKLIAEAWGCGEMFRQWTSPAATFEILKKISRGRPFDFSGIRDYAQIEERRGIQWPYTEADEVRFPMKNEEDRMKNGESSPSSTRNHPSDRRHSDHSSPGEAASRGFAEQERRLFADGKFYTKDQRAKFYFDEPRSAPELPDGRYPFLLLTGRGSSAQWHTGTRTNKSDVLRKLAPRALYIEVNPTDADRLHFRSGQKVFVRSRRGEVTAAVTITTAVQPGQVFLPMHFEVVNTLTLPVFDPHSRQPSYKACAVSVSAK
jgi:assimilatory nitrate reductase catalytic subunit